MTWLNWGDRRETQIFARLSGNLGGADMQRPWWCFWLCNRLWICSTSIHFRDMIKHLKEIMNRNTRRVCILTCIKMWRVGASCNHESLWWRLIWLNSHSWNICRSFGLPLTNSACHIHHASWSSQPPSPITNFEGSQNPFQDPCEKNSRIISYLFCRAIQQKQ